MKTVLGKKICRFMPLMFLALCFAMGMGGFSSSTPAYAADYVVVVNSANTTSGDVGKEEAKNIYLKIKTTWPDGTEAIPFGRPSESAAHQAFLSGILGFSQADLDQHWASEKSKTGQSAPREVGSENILLRQISRKPGAFGVVKAGTSLPSGVKILFTF